MQHVMISQHKLTHSNPRARKPCSRSGPLLAATRTVTLKSKALPGAQICGCAGRLEWHVLPRPEAYSADSAQQTPAAGMVLKSQAPQLWPQPAHGPRGCYVGQCIQKLSGRHAELMQAVQAAVLLQSRHDC